MVLWVKRFTAHAWNPEFNSRENKGKERTRLHKVILCPYVGYVGCSTHMSPHTHPTSTHTKYINKQNKILKSQEKKEY